MRQITMIYMPLRALWNDSKKLVDVYKRQILHTLDKGAGNSSDCAELYTTLVKKDDVEMKLFWTRILAYFYWLSRCQTFSIVQDIVLGFMIDYL